MIRSLYISSRFFQVGIGLVLFWLWAFLWPILFVPAIVCTVFFWGYAVWDIIRLYGTHLEGERICADRFSNGDLNPVSLTLENLSSKVVDVRIIEEFPDQFQIRDHQWFVRLEPKHRRSYQYELRPVKRGRYQFGYLWLYARHPYGWFERRFQAAAFREVAVYPSFHQLKSNQFLAFHRNSLRAGAKKRKRLGLSTEFEQIKNYIPGDDVRHINWKATARKGSLMLNQYRDEKTQQLICMVDKGRRMELPFHDMSLLDYAINASLAISDIALRSEDRVGLLTYGAKLSSWVSPEKGIHHLQRIQEILYHQKTDFTESNVEKAAAWVNRKAYERSLIIYFNNYTSLLSLERDLDYLRALSRRHLLVVVLFKNRPLEELSLQAPQTTREVYHQVVAEQLVQEQQLMVRKLRRWGILSILTHPEDLNISTINTYLRIKKELLV